MEKINNNLLEPRRLCAIVTLLTLKGETFHGKQRSCVRL
jgi:hypothetical protein